MTRRAGYTPLSTDEANRRAALVDECIREMPAETQASIYRWIEGVVDAFNERSFERGQSARLGPAAAKELLYLRFCGAFSPQRLGGNG